MTGLWILLGGERGVRDLMRQGTNVAKLDDVPVFGPRPPGRAMGKYGIEGRGE